MELGAVNIYQKARIDAGFTQEVAAELLDVNTSTVQKWENGTTKHIPTEQVAKMCAAYGSKQLVLKRLIEDPAFSMLMPDDIPECDILEALNWLDIIYRDVGNCILELRKIAADRKISKDEMKEWMRNKKPLIEFGKYIWALEGADGEL